MFSVGRFTFKERVMLIEREIRVLFCVTSDGESRDLRETVISSFSAVFIGLRDSCSWRLHKGRNLRKRNE